MPRSGYRRAFTTPEPDVPLRPESMFHFPESMFHFRRKPCSTSAEIGVPLPPKNPQDYTTYFGTQRDLHARIEDLVEEACPH